jgi:hypothetical protein
LILNPQISTVLKNAKNQVLAFYQEENLEKIQASETVLLLDLEGKNSKCQSAQDLGISGYWWTQI